MRQITAGLTAAQLVRSPRARVTATVEARGQNPTAPSLVWDEVVSNAGQTVFWPTTAVGLANGNVLKFVGRIGDLRKYTITSPTSPSGWSPTPVTVLAASTLALAALRVPNSSTIRLWYINSSNNVQYIESTNDGSTWGSAVTVYSGGAAVLDLVVGYDSTATNGPWIWGVTTQSVGVYTPYFGYYDGASWVSHAYDADWRAAGVDVHSAPSTSARILVVRSRTKGPGRIRRLTKLGASYANAEDIDQTQAGLFGLEISYARFFHLPEAGSCLGIVGEGGYGSGVYLGVAGAFVTVGTGYFVDEGIVLPQVVGVSSQPYACLCSVGTDVYLVGDTVVWRGARQTATADTLEVVRYVYDQNQFEIEFKAGIAALYVGQILVITRTLSFGSNSGSEAVRAIILRVEQGTDKVKVIAADALGWLGTARCRRPSIINDGSAAGVTIVMARLAARFGITLKSDNSALASAAVMPFTLAPAESLAGAAYRIGSQAEYYIVPANDETFGLTLITPGISGSGDYNDTPHVYGAGSTQQLIARAAAVSDYRVLAFSYVLGTYSTDPEDGGAVAMAAGPVIDNTRPLSYSLTNSRYNTTTRVTNAAAAEAARQKKLPITGIIEGQANLALELYDRVTVTEPLLGWSARAFRVRRIDERYDRGRLWQIIYLGDE